MQVPIQHPALSPAVNRWGITMDIRKYLAGASIHLMQPEPGDTLRKARQSSRRRSRRNSYRR
ncbi:hypothetical protein ACIBQ1_47440 [Nonomuraea sp. NPDC050153]|uniref:hypothetical protein n=1 Tax=Nonomuraea sp. NPDC050153 TaxID=3364359 RepID=UPI0037A3C081